MQKDRDLNAAINLNNKPVSYTASYAHGAANRPKTETFRDFCEAGRKQQTKPQCVDLCKFFVTEVGLGN